MVSPKGLFGSEMIGRGVRPIRTSCVWACGPAGLIHLVYVVMNDVQEYEVKNQATEKTHDLTWKTPPM